ncbi:hypothetical protein KPSA1_07472 [Pseudomonas syringae pv. actinidiae]|uniref:Uncharacterized protein n=1 Tax=Pseudomonas syringae pv. actinidiae TaxID=103796 RepID=A0A2V0QMB4_PSESF|nr:hypothetical protein KPSA1_07472 [Pseudomonas syringae pv. actinidiae]
MKHHNKAPENSFSTEAFVQVKMFQSALLDPVAPVCLGFV